MGKGDLLITTGGIKEVCDTKIDHKKGQIKVMRCSKVYSVPDLPIVKGKKFLGYADTKMMGKKQYYFTNKRLRK